MDKNMNLNFGGTNNIFMDRINKRDFTLKKQ